jgi:TFIIF-interacting CTD phosphatase-like protein
MFLAVNGMKTTGYSSGDANKKKSPENKEFSKKKKKTLLEDLQKMAARRSTRRSTAISSLATNNACKNFIVYKCELLAIQCALFRLWFQ